MSFQRVHQSRSQNPQTSSSTSQFAPRPFPVQEPKRPPTQEELENQAFQQNKFEATGLQLKEKYGTITPVEQERLGMLQAKMDSFWAQRMEQAKAQPNLLEILIRNAQSTQAPERANESVAPVQPKLTIGKPNDQYEQEADRVAEQVMSMTPPATPNIQRQAEEEQEEVQTKSLVETITPLVQRQEVLEEDEPIQAKCERCEEEEQVQRSPNGVPQVQTDLKNRLNASRGGGSPLPGEVRSFMEPRFNSDFKDVRVHTGSDAIQMNQDLNAQAFTHKQDIYFGAGKTPGNNPLTAHELTHVVQQNDEVQAKSRNELLQDLYKPEIYQTTAIPALLNKQILQRDCDPSIASCLPESEVLYSAQDSHPVDSEFWFLPSGIRPGSQPIFDDEETQVVVGFRYSSGGYYEIYDLEGRLVDIGEPGLESPLIDPIDILAGGLVGLGRGLLRGGIRAGARGIAGGAGRGTGSSLGSAGLRAAIGALSRRAATAIRATYRAIRFRGTLNFTATTAAHMGEVGRRVPHHILKLAIQYGSRTPDPQGVAGAFRYVIRMFRNGREYTLEVVLREADQTVLHFLYR